jgi:hypothetical protein
LANLGHSISDTTVGNILKDHGIEPAPERKRQTTWHTFLKAHWDVLSAIAFTTVDVWAKRGLVTFYLLFVIAVAGPSGRAVDRSLEDCQHNGCPGLKDSNASDKLLRRRSETALQGFDGRKQITL